MGKLTAARGRLGATPHRLSEASGPGPIRPGAAPWKAWYKTARWQALRRLVIARDGATCRRCQRVCFGRYPDDSSPVVDHIRPHRGDAALFWDEANLQLLCKSPCHDQAKQAEEQATRHHVGVWD